jgi:ABC-type multidrug transport system fused ATPase/permease subunit
LSKNADPDLRVYAVWFNMLFGDSRERWDGDGVTDPRVRHFWDEQRLVGTLGLAPALVTKGLIDYLANPTQGLHSRSGDLLSRMNNDVGGIEDVVSQTVFGLVANVVTLAATLALMLALDWRLTVAALVLMPLVLIPSRYVGQVTYRARKRTQEKLAKMSSAQIGIVFQDTFLFHASVRQNLLYARPEASTPNWSRQPGLPTSMSSSTRCPMGTTRSSASAGTVSAAARSNESRSPA